MKRFGKICLMVLIGLISGGIVPAAYYGGKGSKDGPIGRRWYWYLCMAYFPVWGLLMLVQLAYGRWIAVGIQLLLWIPVSAFAYKQGQESR